MDTRLSALGLTVIGRSKKINQSALFHVLEESVKFMTHRIIYTSFFRWLVAESGDIKYFHQNYYEISVFDSTYEIN
ncbi:hypothetical protein DP117_03010 [Brasilonema sp. UFV-L1]|nr:hypothetical protein [Brasilonema sp. UFV-L1]